MKPIIRWAMLAAVLMATGSTVQAQQQASNKVGVVNLGTLFTKYPKALALKKELEADLAPIKGEADKIKNIVDQHIEYLKTSGGKNPGQDEISRKAVTDGKRRLEDLDFQARQKVGKKQEVQLIALYKELHAGVQMYAQQHGYHIVLAYGESEQDPFSAKAISRRVMALDSGASVAFYVQNDLDITNDALAWISTRSGGARP